MNNLANIDVVQSLSVYLRRSGTNILLFYLPSYVIASSIQCTSGLSCLLVCLTYIFGIMLCTQFFYCRLTG